MTKNLISEQLPKDGSFQMYEILDAANERLGRLGKHGKRCKLKRTGNKVVLQFSFQGKQKQKSSDWSFSKQGIVEAEKIAARVTDWLTANQFSMEWLDSLLGKSKSTEEKKQLTCAEMITEYKEYWFRENKKLKNCEKSWYCRFRYIENIFSQINASISLETIKQVIEATEKDSQTRTFTIQALKLILEYFSIEDFEKKINQYKTKNKPKKKTKHIPNDGEIISVYNLGFIPDIRCSKKYLRSYSQWKFLYGLLATYGLRIHEAWNIANWDKPVILKDEDWIEVSLEDETGNENNFGKYYKGKDEVIPAIKDPNNKLHILAIKHDTKTGYRMAMPLSPIGHDWLKEFNLIGEFNLPNLKNPLLASGKNKRGSYNCALGACRWFIRHEYGFTPHALRHAYNHRAHQQGVNPKTIADSLGHSMQMNSTVYLNSMPSSRKMQMMKKEIQDFKDKQSEVEKLREEIKHLKAENERLRTELKMYEAINKNK